MTLLTKRETGKSKKPRNPCGSEVFLVRGTGLELTRRHVTLGRPVSKSTASKTSIEVVRVRQR